jgi:hypothetical protein
VIPPNISPIALAFALAMDAEMKSNPATDLTLGEILDAVTTAKPELDLAAGEECATALNIFRKAIGASKDAVILTGILSVDGLLAVKASKNPLSTVRFSCNPKNLIEGMAASVGIPLADTWPAMEQELTSRTPPKEEKSL